MLQGWVQSVRAHKTRLFVDVNDGTSPTNTQLVVPLEIPNHSFSSDINKLKPGTYVRARGYSHSLPATNQNPWLSKELRCIELFFLAPSDPSVSHFWFLKYKYKLNGYLNSSSNRYFLSILMNKSKNCEPISFT